ncbi:hypothetical protein BC937DRAFT_87611 [Endogone sp. FLAS-F59071]|nr:hypothetical protein BC937DRAFT_87611 [Endogone sp. FLAS-F59071]|eukprot:RUS19359.1 hypothetical protein BC937DRAFT_87611 [Endogone sp. FLAS-F59071]
MMASFAVLRHPPRFVTGFPLSNASTIRCISESGTSRMSRRYYKAKYGGRSRGQHEEGLQAQIADSSLGGGPMRPSSRVAPQSATSNFQGLDSRTHTTLRDILLGLQNRHYSLYKQIQGEFLFPNFTLCIDHVQSDPYAPPSRIRVRVPQAIAKFPQDLYASKIRNIALTDYLTRAIWDHVYSNRLDIREDDGGWSGQKGQKSSDFRIDKPGQQVLQRTSVMVKNKWVEARCTVGLPAQGRTILGDWAAQILIEHLSHLVSSTLIYSALDATQLRKHIECVEDQEWLRGQLRDRGLISFVCNGAILPRESGASDLPMTSDDVIAFASPQSMEVEYTLPNTGPIKGMGLPRGIVLITGKSTLLKALEFGVYNYIPGDGREFVCTDAGVVKIRAEDGRSVEGTNITPFISNLPFGKDTQRFSTKDASGSTSMAANIQEALEVGATGFLYDEDTCATNFLIRDKRMQKLIAKSDEPITPLIYKVRQMASELGVATVIVIGGCGDYMDVADVVVEMRNYLPKDVTVRAKQIACEFPSNLADEGGTTYGTVTTRIPIVPPLKGKPPVTKSLHHIQYNTTDLSLLALDQLVSTSQTRCIADAITFAQRQLQGCTMHETMDALERVFDEEGEDETAGLGRVHPEGWIVGLYARPRIFEIAAAMSRLREVGMRQAIDGHDQEQME